MITQTIEKSKTGLLYTDTIPSQTSPYVKKVLIGSIPIKTYFDNDIQVFYDTYHTLGAIKFELNVNINSTNLDIASIEKVYQSDGTPYESRPLQWEDVVDVYANVNIPVTYEMHSESTSDLFHLDFNPSPGHRYTVAEQGFNQWIPGDVSVEGDYEEIEHPTNELLVKEMHVYLRPTGIYDGTMNNMSLINGTAKKSAIYHTDEGHWFEPDDYYYDPTMLRLGKFQVQANSKIEKDMIILDTRTRGGGLDEALTNDIIQRINKESMYHWDIGFHDGLAYQENGVFILRLPRSILNDFTQTEIQSAVAKYKAYGNLPIIEYFDPAPVDYNLIDNYEFKNEKHIGQYNPAISSGNYVIDNNALGNGNDGILKLMEKAKYGITIPATRIKFPRYLLSIKAKLDTNASSRRAATVLLTYQDGTIEQIPMENIVDTDWIVYQKEMDIKPNMVKVEVVLNDDPLATGNVFIDYVKMVPVFTYGENLEIIEI